MSDVVERLRSGELCGEDRCRVMDAEGGCTCAIAAAEIERLRADLDHWQGTAYTLSSCWTECNKEVDRLRARLAREQVPRDPDMDRAIFNDIEGLYDE